MTGASADEVKQKIIAAALAEVGSVGLKRTTMKRVAERADVATSLISYYFGSKEQLLEACAQEWSKTAARLSATLLGLFTQGRDRSNEELIRAILRETVNTGRAHQVELRLMLRSAALTTEGAVPVIPQGMGFLAKVDVAISKRLGCSPERVRAVFHQAAMLLVRACLLTDVELETIYGTASAEGWERCIAHLETTFVAAFAADLPVR